MDYIRYITPELIQEILEFQTWNGQGWASNELQAGVSVLQEIGELIQNNSIPKTIEDAYALQQEIATLLQQILSIEPLRTVFYNFLDNEQNKNLTAYKTLIELAKIISNSHEEDTYLRVFLTNPQSDLSIPNEEKLLDTKALDSIIKRSGNNYSLYKQIKPAEKAGLTLLKQIAAEIQKYTTVNEDKQRHITPEQNTLLRNAILKILKQAITKDPILIWNLCCNFPYSEITRALTALASDIVNSTDPKDYLAILFPTAAINIPIGIPLDKFSQNLTLLITEIINSDKEVIHTLEIIDLETLKNQYIQNGNITDSNGVKLSSDSETQTKKLLRKQYPDVQAEMMRAEKMFDPLKLGLKIQTIQILYNLAKTGSTAMADRPDLPNDRDPDLDEAYIQLRVALEELELKDPEEYKKLMNCNINGTTFKSEYASIWKGNCAGTFKRNIAKFLCENVDISSEWQKELKACYTNAKNWSNDSKSWEKSALQIKIIGFVANAEPIPQVEENNHPAVASQKMQIESLLNQYADDSRTELAQILKNLSSITQELEYAGKNFISVEQAITLQKQLVQYIEQLNLYLEKSAKILEICETHSLEIPCALFKELREEVNLRDNLINALQINSTLFIDALKYDDPALPTTAEQLIDILKITVETLHIVKFSTSESSHTHQSSDQQNHNDEGKNICSIS